MESRSELGNGAVGYCLSHVLPGTYVLIAEGTAHKRFESAPFSLADGESVDMGRVTLQPADAVILEVVDSAGVPVTSKSVCFPDNKALDEEMQRRIVDTVLYGGKRIFTNDSVPAGPVRVRITANGFKEQETTITRSPLGLQVVRVVLERE